MINNIPNVYNDQGFLTESLAIADKALDDIGPMSLRTLPQIIRDAVAKAYMRGAQEAISYGYKIAWKEQKSQLPEYRALMKEYDKAKAEYDKIKGN